jgi:hypothetical protein
MRAHELGGALASSKDCRAKPRSEMPTARRVHWWADALEHAVCSRS